MERFRPWAIGLTLQTDEAQSESLYTTFSWGVAENTWLFFAAGQRYDYESGGRNIEADVQFLVPSLGITKPLGDGAWSVRLYHKPFIRWIWLGAILMGFGGLVAAK